MKGNEAMTEQIEQTTKTEQTKQKKTTPAVRARAAARQKVAERLAAEQARAKANEDDLTTMLLAASKLDDAEQQRDKAIAEATRRYEETTARVRRDSIAGPAVRMKQRGESISYIAQMSGIAATTISQLVKDTENASTSGNNTKKSVEPEAKAAEPPNDEPGEPQDAEASAPDTTVATACTTDAPEVTDEGAARER